MSTETDEEEGGLAEEYDFPPKAYRPADMPSAMVKRNEIHNWTAAAHLEVQTQMMMEQTKVLKEIRDELKSEE